MLILEIRHFIRFYRQFLRVQWSTMSRLTTKTVFISWHTVEYLGTRILCEFVEEGPNQFSFDFIVLHCLSYNLKMSCSKLNCWRRRLTLLIWTTKFTTTIYNHNLQLQLTITIHNYNLRLQFTIYNYNLHTTSTIYQLQHTSTS